MIFACLAFAHALTQQSPVPVDFKINHLRASRVLERIQTGLGDAKVTADDAHGMLRITGNKEAVDGVRQLAKQFDVAQRRVEVAVTIDSPVDKELNQTSAKLYNYQMWKQTYGDSGITVGIQPRINDDGTVTLFLAFGHENANSLSSVIRLKFGSSKTLILGSKGVTEYHQQPDGRFKTKSIVEPEPRITVRIEE